MQKSLLRLATVGATLLLAACAGGTPECGSSKAKADLREVADQRIAQEVGAIREHPLVTSDEFATAVKDRLSFAFKSIRTLSHDEDTDTYQCASVLSVTVDGKVQSEQDFEYDIYSVEDPDRDYEIRYDASSLSPLAYGAGRIGQEVAVTAEVKDVQPRYEAEIKKVRDSGRAGTQRERELISFLKQGGIEVPPATEEQRRLAIEEMRKMDYPGNVYSDVPQEVQAEAEARRARAFEEKQIKEQEAEDARRKRCNDSPQPGLGINCG